MSEIKGQLLGIILVLMIFAVTSGVIATVFKKAGDSITLKSEHTFDGASSVLNYTEPTPSGSGGSQSGTV